MLVLVYCVERINFVNCLSKLCLSSLSFTSRYLYISHVCGMVTSPRPEFCTCLFFRSPLSYTNGIKIKFHKVWDFEINFPIKGSK